MNTDKTTSRRRRRAAAVVGAITPPMTIDPWELKVVRAAILAALVPTDVGPPCEVPDAG